MSTAMLLTDLDEYQNLAKATAVYPGAGEGGIEAISYLGLGLGESGEVQGKIKKLIRDKGGEISDEDRSAIAAELGDVLWYVSNLAGELGVSLSTVASDNVAKLASRQARGKLTGSGDNR